MGQLLRGMQELLLRLLQPRQAEVLLPGVGLVLQGCCCWGLLLLLWLYPALTAGLLLPVLGGLLLQAAPWRFEFGPAGL